MPLAVRMSVKYKKITKPLRPAQIRKVFRDSVREEGKHVKAWYTSLQANFSPKNRTKILRKTGSGSLLGMKGTIYSAVGSNQTRGSVLRWLEEGTSVRYRGMSPNWRSKTSPGGGLNISASKGYASGWGIFPGIKPRNFRDHIVEIEYPRWVKRADKDLTKMLKGAGWIE